MPKLERLRNKRDKLSWKLKECERQIEEEEILQKEEWITRLLEYANLSEEDMKRVVEKDKRMAELAENMNAMQSAFGRFAVSFRA